VDATSARVGVVGTWDGRTIVGTDAWGVQVHRNCVFGLDLVSVGIIDNMECAEEVVLVVEVELPHVLGVIQTMEFWKAGPSREGRVRENWHDDLCGRGKKRLVLEADV